MPEPITAGILAAGTIGGGLLQSSAISKAGNAEAAAANAGVAEQRAAREELRTLLAPYSKGGVPALDQLMAIAGLGQPESIDWQAYVQNNPDALENWNAVRGTPSDTFGGDIAKFGEFHYNADGARRDLAPFTTQATSGADAQRDAISGIESSPIFHALARQGEDAILQNSSATGGLRGGNVQGALGQFRPQMLNQFIEQQYGRLGGIAQMGQQSAAGVGSSGITSATNISQLLANAGSARAGAALGQGNVWGGVVNSAAEGFGAFPGGAAGLFKRAF